MDRSQSPINAEPVKDEDVPFFHECYTYTTDDNSDATMIWGSQVDMTNLQLFIKRRNSTGNVLLTPTTILVRAVGIALHKHPEANSRLLGSRIYRFSEQNVVLPLQTRSGPQLLVIRNVDQRDYESIAAELRDKVTEEINQTRAANIREKLTRGFPHRLRGIGVRFLIWLANHIRMPKTSFTQHLVDAPVIVNYFGFRCAPPLLAYKPSRFASRSLLLNVTLGPISPQPMVIDEDIVIRPTSGLFVRGDHRTMDAQQLAGFVRTLVQILEDPERFERDDCATDSNSGV